MERPVSQAKPTHQLILNRSLRQGAGGVGGDERVGGVGFGVAGVEVGDAAHCQAGQVEDLMTGGPGDRDRQRPDRSRLRNTLKVLLAHPADRSPRVVPGLGIECPGTTPATRPTQSKA